MASNSQSSSIDSQSRNVHRSIVDIFDQADEAGDPCQDTPATQASNKGADQLHGTGTASTLNTVAGDHPNVASNDSTPASKDSRLAGLTPVQRFRLLEREAEKHLVAKRLKLAKMQSTRGHRREHSDDHYCNDTHKKASVFKKPETQHLNNYNSAVMFLQDFKDYIDSATRIDFQSD